MDTADTRPKPAKPLFECKEFFVTKWSDPARKPFKLEIRASFAGKKLRSFWDSEEEAISVGSQLVDQIRNQGRQSIETGGLTVKAAVAQFLPRVEGSSKSHRQKTEQICGILKERFGAMSLKAIGPEHVESIMRKGETNGTTQAGYFRYLRMFFRWAERRDMIDRNPMRAIDCPTSRPLRNILTPEDLETVLALEMPKWLRATVLLGAFAGLRSEEMVRMNWEDIDTKAEQIHIRPGVQKDSGGFFERIVDMMPPLIRRKEEISGVGKLVPVVGRKLHTYRERYILGPMDWKEWPKNCLRHSFATYHLAKTKNPGLTAFQMGHTSPAMVQRVYAVPAKKADWRKWWAL
ncbi:site-specific recombinase XerD [Terrimicrobium sacchariphilum]|uniref:Site-specific recombinase XerD n=1 Tax=Terrimicrobium sacchariphilum TaxID=690879 RepID=A0A146G6W4_TERSA|nr:hypothetical protein [Terrimicrobium sacchariphilum]GAT33310.1 site-specific recombinase XerD [Terrimicrobium sacchariphilum]